jgi:CheY-like chemotaxis protein
LKKIFIADDDPDILEILGLMLKTAGYRIHATPNANEIFDYTENFPDLILLDIWMSGLDGRDICKRLKETQLTKHIPVVFLSANSKIKEIAGAYNAHDYIAKPFEMEHLLQKVSDIIKETAA